MPTKPKPLELEALMNYAARSLSARAQSSSELRTRLKRRAAHAQDVEQVLARLKDAGLINDQQFASAFTSWRKENQGFGKTRVMRDLMARRVAPALAQRAVDAAYENVDETALIEAFLKRKYRGKDLGALLAEEKHLASAFRKLRAAGFSPGASIRTLKRYAAQADQLDED
ncbi:MAG TPA: RecX family transcriptional regulator [Bryobacteraceae bacterium]|nr:RecX family transcriptional regulator [Bryobacteraceae bacterium]